MTIKDLLENEQFCNSETKIQLNWQQKGSRERKEENGGQLDDVILAFMDCELIYMIADLRKNRLEIWTNGQPYEWYDKVKAKAGAGTAEGQSG